MTSCGGPSVFLAGLVAGTLTGLAVGLLASPKSGQENRALLEDQFPELRARLPEMKESVLTEAKTRLAAGEAAFRHGVSETREALTRQLDRAQRGEPTTR